MTVGFLWLLRRGPVSVLQAPVFQVPELQVSYWSNVPGTGSGSCVETPGIVPRLV
jgi:hypothetical protein